MTDNLTSATPTQKQKIKTPFAKIIVQGSMEAPYYCILYFNTEKNEMCEGYGSFLLPAVYAWLKNEFEIVEQARAELLVKTRDADPATNAVEVVHGRWILTANEEYSNYRWNVTAECSECHHSKGEIYAGFFPGLPTDLAREVVLDNAEKVKLDNYCPNCGAKMDGGIEDGTA